MDPRLTPITGHLEEDRLAWRLPGLAAVLVVDGRPAWSCGLGRRDELGAGVDEHTVWRVGAVGQPVLAAAMGHLADQGILDLDDSLSRWLPEIEELGAALDSRDPARAAITLGDCAAHTAGLPPLPPMSDDDLAALRFPSMDEVLAALSGVARYVDGATSMGTDAGIADESATNEELKTRASHAPDRTALRFSYSNLGWALLAEALSRAAGRPITDYAAEHIFGPLGMTASSWEPSSLDVDRVATGFAAFGDPPQPAPDPTPGAFAAPWGLWSSTADMARFLAWQLQSDDGQGTRPASAAKDSPTTLAMLRRLQTPRIIDASKVSGATPGWLVGLTTAGPTLFHGGADPGFASYSALVPRKGLAVFVAANRASNPEALGEMGHGILAFAEDALAR